MQINAETLETIHKAKETVTRLVEVCRKGGTLYAKQPKEIAQVNRTAKWLLNAIGRLNKELSAQR